MNQRPPVKPDPEVLSGQAAARLLERASELDVARGGSSVADLRAAALEAGISGPAFDAALAELQDRGSAPMPGVREGPRRRPWTWALTAAATVVFLVITFAVGRLVAPANVAAVPGPAMVEQSIELRCLSPGEAAILIRPLLTLRSNTVVASPSTAPRVLTVRATPAQMEDVKALLEKSEGAGSPACAARPK